MQILWSLSYGELHDEYEAAKRTLVRCTIKVDMFVNAIERLKVRLNNAGQAPGFESYTDVMRLLVTARRGHAQAEIDYSVHAAYVADLRSELERRDPPTHWYRRDGSRRYGNNPRSVKGGL